MGQAEKTKPTPCLHLLRYTLLVGVLVVPARRRPLAGVRAVASEQGIDVNVRCVRPKSDYDLNFRFPNGIHE